MTSAHDADRAARTKLADSDTDGDSPKPAEPKEPVGPGSRVALRNWRISTRLVSLLALPVAAATTLGVLRIDSSLDNVNQLENMQLLTEMTDHATQLAVSLQEERDRSAGPLTGNGNAKDDTVVAPREETDKAKRDFNEATTSIEVDDPAMAGVQATVADIARQLNTIRGIRERAYAEPTYVSQTVNSYNQLIESLLSLSLDMAQATSNSEMIRNTRALAAFSSAKEYASIQRSIIAAGLARKGGPELSESDRLYAKTASESESAALKSFTQIYGDERALELIKPLNGQIVNITAADQYAGRVLKDPDGIKSENRSYMDWFDQDRTKIDEMAKIEAYLLGQMEQQARALRSDAQQDALINGALILLVLGISLTGAFIVARSMVRSLRRLQNTAQDVARKRLPELVKELSEAEPQDVDTSVESVGVHSRDEIGKVAAAFDDVHREAVRLASEQALLRGNVNAMFTNLSRRSQSLIQRQLSLISELESREADPDQLSSLFKLDHLATRMRRNGENLLVLAGEEPGRRWTRPVPLVDVLRAAASEVEQYERIELNAVPATEVAGRVVNDLVHLLAELLENATSFSSPQTKVKVTGHALPDGRVLVEIHDTGIGLSHEDLSAINDRLANPPTVDVSVSRRMGLFVVGRLSLRHGIRIQLRPSDSGGTTALVMLPVDVAQGGRKPAPTNDPATTTVQREPASLGSPSRTGASSRLGALPTRGQVTGGTQRPALTAQGNSAEGNGGGPGPSRPQGQLPTRRPGASTPVGTNSGPEPTSSTRSLNLFGTEESTRRRAGGGPRHGGAGRPAPELPEAGSPRPSWASGRPERVPGPRSAMDTSPDQDVESTGEFSRPEMTRGAAESFRDGDQGPDDTASFARPQFSPAPTERGFDRFPENPRSEGHDQFSSPDTHRDVDRFSPTDEPEDPDRFSLTDEPEDTGHFLGADGLRESDPFPPSRQPEQRSTHGELPRVEASRRDERTPIFESIESNWFSSGPAEADRSAPQTSARTPHPAESTERYEPTSAHHEQPASDGPAAPRWGTDSGAGSADPDARWTSPNDERWRQAEQTRQPAAGGVTTSGLPRRVPRANLIAGTAQQRPSPRVAGPQVSRAPDDVRGRLTNLRRGIQRGRQAGGASSSSTDRGFDPTYQQER